MDTRMTDGLCFYLDAIYDMRQLLRRNMPAVNRRTLVSKMFWEDDYRKPVLRNLTRIFQQNQISSKQPALKIGRVSIFPWKEV